MEFVKSFFCIYWDWSEVKVAQSCLTLCNPMDYTVHGILQARILEWIAIPFSRGSSWPRNQTGISWIAGGFFTSWATREASIEIITWFLSFNLLIWCITLIDLHIWENPCISGINPSWLWYMIFLICCCILFARILLRMFYLCPSMILYWPVIFFFFVVFLSGFGSRVIVASLNEFGNVPSSANVWKSFRRMGFSFSLNVWYN